MRKKILIIEKSETIRSVAENLLRKNGYEVIGLTDPEKALELIEFTRPDLILAGSELKSKDSKPFYEAFQVNSELNRIPLLLFADEGNDSLPFPPEVLVYKPLDPKDFLGKVAVFAAPRAGQPDSMTNQSDEESLTDEFLDAALGVDNFDVLESEVIGNTTSKTGIKRKVAHKNDLGLGPATGVSKSDSTGVESIKVKNDSSKIVRIEHSKRQVDVAASSKIDILDDQYGISDPGSVTLDGGDAGHDYDWFVNEMQSEASAEAASPASAAKVAPASDGGVEKFIDEFKKEVQKFQDDELLGSPNDALVQETKVANEQSGLENTVGDVSEEQLNLFTRQLSYDLAERIAVKIIERIDSEKLLRMIKDEIVSKAKRKSKPGK